jgi:hypothetical protein
MWTIEHPEDNFRRCCFKHQKGGSRHPSDKIDTTKTVVEMKIISTTSFFELTKNC